MTRGARTLAIVFLAVTVPTAATLIWLGLRLLDQDRTLWAQRELDRRQQDAETAARVLHDRLQASLDELQPHGLRLHLGPDSIVPDDVTRILWLPVVARETPDPSTQFFELESREFARMESGRKPYELRRVEARALAAQVARAVGAEVAPRGYRVELDDGGSGELTMEADTESLAHALWNLLDNAVKYSPGRRDVVLSVRAHPEGVAFAVTDHGMGIPASERAEIFTRFVRGARARELGIKGTGLGLAMVQHIVTAHRGRVEVESQEGEGSTFRVVLPAAA